MIRTLLLVLVSATATIHCAHRQSVYVYKRDEVHQGATKLYLLWTGAYHIFILHCAKSLHGSFTIYGPLTSSSKSGASPRRFAPGDAKRSGFFNLGGQRPPKLKKPILLSRAGREAPSRGSAPEGHNWNCCPLTRSFDLPWANVTISPLALF